MLKYSAFYIFMLLMSFKCASDRKWMVLELTYSDGWYSGYVFRMNANGICEWQIQNSDSLGICKTTVMPAATMNSVNEILVTDDFVADTSHFGCIDCDFYWLYVRYSDGSVKLESYTEWLTSSSGTKVIDELTAFITNAHWRDSTDARLHLELMEEMDKKWDDRNK